MNEVHEKLVSSIHCPFSPWLWVILDVQYIHCHVHSNQSNDENHHSGPKVVYVGDVHRVYQMDSHNIPLHLLYEVK